MTVSSGLLWFQPYYTSHALCTMYTRQARDWHAQNINHVATDVSCAAFI
jgi:hypothetical protein